MSILDKLRGVFKPSLKLPEPILRDEKEVKEQLALLADISKRTGILHEVQKTQLDYWVWIVLPNIVEHGLIAFPEDPQTHKAMRMVEYRVITDKKKVPDLDKRLAILDQHVKFLLGQDVALRVVINDELAFTGNPNDSNSSQR